MKKILVLSVIFILIFIAVKSNIINRGTGAPPSSQSVSTVSSQNDTQQNQTPSSCIGKPTQSQTAGPYYKTNSTKKNNIAQNIPGEKLKVTGYVFDNNCQPVENVWLDFWQADSNGQYDNINYNLRGHQFTDSQGRYNLETIIPAAYESRPPHIHVKIQPPNGKILTTQLYFPNQSQNQSDSIFNPALVMELTEENGDKIGQFNFVLSQ